MLNHVNNKKVVKPLPDSYQDLSRKKSNFFLPICIFTFTFCLLTSYISFAQYTKLFDFSGATNGRDPECSLISDGTFLYGMTLNGGTNDLGVIFKIKLDGTGDTVLFNFSGTTGANPEGSLIFDGTFLYGMTYYGGTNIMGVLFKIKPDGTGFAKLLDFSGTTNGSYPHGSLISDGTFLYGMTIGGGTYNNGVLFKILPDGSGYSKLLDFANDTVHGASPYGSLIFDGSFLYGMTIQGGINNMGTIFKIKPDGTGYSKLMDFSGAINGMMPSGDLVSDGTFLYGMTNRGGTGTCPAGCGVIFKIKPDGTGYSKLLDFDAGPKGSYPDGSLIFDGTFLYGMTSQHGGYNNGTIFKIKPDGSGYSKLFDFGANISGDQPYGSLISDQGICYGMTHRGGTNDMGVIFKYNTFAINNINSTMVSCYGSNNATAIVTASGGLTPYTYLWNSSPVQSTQTATALAPGNYTVSVTDAHNTTATANVTITQPNAIAIVITPLNANCDYSGNANAMVTGGISPYSYLWSNGQTASVAIGLASGIYTFTVTDTNSCIATQTISIANNLPTAPSICAVTVDSLSKNNIILWDKTPYTNVDSFIIYREITTNNYQLVGAVSFDSLSMFIDTVRAKWFPYTGDPNNGTYRYKLAIHDTCGNYSATGLYHNTIFTTNNSGTFSWNFYTIENTTNPATGYLLMRDDSSNGNWHTVAGVSGTQQSVADPQYSTYQSTASWRVETQWNISCTPIKKNPQPMSVNFNASRSNSYKANSAEIEEYENEFQIRISPNPTSGLFQILSNKLRITNIEIYNVYGEKVYSSLINSKSSIINLDEPNGVYFLQLKTNKCAAVKKIVISH